MYISCEANSLITTNNQHIISDGNNIKLENKTFVTVSYCDSPLTQTAILKDGNILKSDGVYLIDLKVDKLLCFFKPIYYQNNTILAKTSRNGCEVSIFTTDKLYAYIKTDFDVGLFNLPYFEQSITLDFVEFRKAKLLTVYLVNNKKLFVYDVTNKVTNVGVFNADSFSFSEILTVNESFCDTLKHKRTTDYVYSNFCFTKRSERLAYAETDVFLLSDSKKRIAFFESVLLSGDVKGLVTESLYQNKDKFNAYLNDFLTVSPCHFDNTLTALLYKSPDTGCDFYAKYIKVDFENGLINNFGFID